MSATNQPIEEILKLWKSVSELAPNIIRYSRLDQDSFLLWFQGRHHICRFELKDSDSSTYYLVIDEKVVDVCYNCSCADKIGDFFQKVQSANSVLKLF